ncbi:hypothetical protein ACFL08_04775 [Patescibacteria group bacterium]
MSTGKNKKGKNSLIDMVRRNKDRILIFIGIILISFISFEIGVLEGMEWKQKAVVIEKVPENKIVKLNEKGSCSSGSVNSSQVLGVSDSGKKDEGGQKKCLFVGSKNSNKIHKQSCHWSGKIKEGNKVCFDSTEEAEKGGYVPASCMKK